MLWGNEVLLKVYYDFSVPLQIGLISNSLRDINRMYYRRHPKDESTSNPRDKDDIDKRHKNIITPSDRVKYGKLIEEEDIRLGQEIAYGSKSESDSEESEVEDNDKEVMTNEPRCKKSFKELAREEYNKSKQ